MPGGGGVSEGAAEVAGLRGHAQCAGGAGACDKNPWISVKIPPPPPPPSLNMHQLWHACITCLQKKFLQFCVVQTVFIVIFLCLFLEICYESCSC